MHAEPNRINYWSQPGAATNPVFSFFKEVYLAPFELAETRDMLNGIGQLMGYSFDDPLIGAIHAESGGYPILSRQIASILIGWRKGKPITSGQVALTLDARNRESLEGLFDLQSSLSLSNYCKESILKDMEIKGPRGAGEILRVLAATGTPVLEPALRERLGADYAEAEIRNALVTLRQYGLVERNRFASGEGYRIIPALFARWLRSSMTDEKAQEWAVSGG